MSALFFDMNRICGRNRCRLPGISGVLLCIALYLLAPAGGSAGAAPAENGQQTVDGLNLLTLTRTEGNRGIDVTDINDFAYIRYPGMGLLAGDIINTRTARAELALPGNSGKLLVAPRTTAEIGGTPGVMFLLLEAGMVRFDTSGPDTLRGEHTIETDVSVAEFDSANLIVERSIGASHTVQVFAGTVRVYNKLTEEMFVVDPGCQFDLFGLESSIAPIASAAREGIVCDTATGRAIAPPPAALAAEIPEPMHFTGENFAAAAVAAAPLVPTLPPAAPAPQVAPPAPPAIDDVAQAPEDTAVDENEAEEEESIAEEPEIDAEQDSEKNNYFYVGAEVETGYQEGIYGIIGAKVGVRLGDTLQLGLIFPVTFRTNPLDPNTWVTYAGSHDWNFGAESALPGEDIARDIVNKIDYLHFGNIDSVWGVYVGDLTGGESIGSGYIVNDYENALDLPLARRVGGIAALDFSFFTLKLLVDELVRPRFAALYTQLISGPIAFGLGVYGNWNLQELIGNARQETIDVTSIGVGIVSFDIAILIRRDDPSSGRLFVETAAFVPFSVGPNVFDVLSLLRTDGQPWINNYLLGAGFEFDVFTDNFSGKVRAAAYNWGGIATPLLYDATFDRRSVSWATLIYNQIRQVISITSLAGIPFPTNRNHELFLGPYIELNFGNQDRSFVLGFEYLAPIRLLPSLEFGNDDVLGIHVVYEPGFGNGLFLEVYYDRRGLFSTLTNATGSFEENIANLLDGFSNYGVNVGYQFAQGYRVSAGIGAAAQRDDLGFIINTPAGVPVTEFSIRLNAVVTPHFFF